MAAESVDELLARFASTKFDDVEAGIAGIAVSGSPQATAILDALGAGNLLIQPAQRRAYIKTPGRRTARRRHRQPGAARPDRGLAEADQGQQPDPARHRGCRRQPDPDEPRPGPAPGSGPGGVPVARRCRPAGARPGHRRRAGSLVKQALAEARAAILLPMPGTADPVRLEAVETLRDPRRPESLAILTALPDTAPDSVRVASDAATAAIERHLGIVAAAQNIVFGISLGSVLLLAAIGLAITFGVMGVINMAHGEMVMLGAYTTFVIQEFCRTSFPAGLELSLPGRGAGGVPGLRGDGRADRADHHPPALWPPARDAARHLGHLADPAAAGAQHLRPEQPRGLDAVLDERLGRAGRRLHHHRQPPGDRHLLPGGVRGPVGGDPPDPLRPRDARRHPEPARWPRPWASAPAGSTP